MRLKRLELFGFKSFADRTALDFPRSLTGIVGPNGCGKSNVVDGVRWVLGEQRPTSMRGGEMSDVIFKGSTSRPAMAVAEVSLVLDNSGSELEGHGAEVSITRRVFKSGEGEYLINGERVRLKDVRDMLFDTGLGSRGYAVLEQGKIDAVLSQNPLDRRSIFEEAAGISRFRMRKRETETRLKRVEADMLRLDDVLRELSTRVRSLKIQAGKAERFVSARDDWRRERARLLRQRATTSGQALEQLRLRVDAVEARSAELRAARESGEGEVTERGREQSSLTAELERLSGEISRLAGEGRALTERRAQMQDRTLAWRASAREESERSGMLERQLSSRRLAFTAVESTLAELAQRALDTEQRRDLQAERLQQARNEYRATRERSEAQNEDVLRALHEKTAAANSARLLEASRGPLLARRERALGRLAENDALAAALREVASDAAARVESARLSLADSEQERARLVLEFARLETAARALEADQKTLELERARIGSRIAVLRDFERERESLDAGARALLAEIRGKSGPIRADELTGLFADHVHASTDLARALDAALGERALALVAKSSDTALRAASWLKQRQHGQVRLVLAGTLGDFELPPAPAFSEAERGLIIARLCDEVSADLEFQSLSRYLIGDVFVATDVAACLRLAQAHPRWRFATREGDLVDAAGFVGGHREIAQGAVGRRSSADQLERTAGEISARIAALDAEQAAARSAHTDLLQSRAGTERVFEERRQAMADAEREYHTSCARLADLESALGMARRESEAVGAEVARLDSDIAAAKDRVLTSEAHFGELNQELAQLERARHEQEGAREKLTREEQQLSVECARLRAELEGHQRRHADLTRGVDETQLELERSLRLASESIRSAEEAELDIAALEGKSDLLLLERAGLDERAALLRTHERAARESIDVFRRRLDAATRELEGAALELAELRLEQQRASLERAEALARAQEDLGLDELALTQTWDLELGPEPALETVELTALEQRVAALKQDLDRIGPVNTEAVAELSEADGRFTFLDTQRKDLLRARESLALTLTTINEESVRLFLSTFEEVRGHFQQLFRQLFGGGKADLELQAGVDPLEGGIEISARPPGREMLPIGLLSGGQRTMTALALLFAVFKARPSPFCILDEVDAALDDANIGRFLGMLDSFRHDTQFVIVTHNKGSMAACEGLYGITMEVKGVSRYVAVEFGEVERFVPDATGDAAKASRSRDEVQSRGKERPIQRKIRSLIRVGGPLRTKVPPACAAWNWCPHPGPRARRRLPSFLPRHLSSRLGGEARHAAASSSMTNARNAFHTRLELTWLALVAFQMAAWAQEPNSTGAVPTPGAEIPAKQDPIPTPAPVVDPPQPPIAGTPPAVPAQEPARGEAVTKPVETAPVLPTPVAATSLPSDGVRTAQPGLLPTAAATGAPSILNIPRDLASVAAELDRIIAEHGTLARALDLGSLTDGRKLPALLFGAEGPLALEDRPTILLLGALDGESPTGGLAVLAVSTALLNEPTNLPGGVAFAAVPWASPEGLELSLQGLSCDGRNTRPVDEDRDGRVDEDGPDDLDGDRMILQMLVQDPEGPWIRPEGQRLLARARPGDAPRYSLTLEGKDDDGDGLFNEDGPGGVVLDLNFPVGRTGPWVDNLAGVLPLTEALSRTYADFAIVRHAAVVILFQGNHGRMAIPGGSRATTAKDWMPEADRNVFQGVNTSFSNATARRNLPLSTLLDCRGSERRGAAIDWFYSVGGALALEIAPWGPALDAPLESGPENARFDNPKVENGRKAPDGVSPEDLAWIRWLDDKSGGIGFTDWHPVDLGPGGQVLVGGWEPGARTIPPKDYINRALQGLAEFTRRLSASLPRLDVRVAEASREGDVCRIRARLSNSGSLPTGLAISDRRAGAVGAWLALQLPEGATLVAGSERCVLTRLAGNGISRECEWLVFAPAGSTFTLRAGGDWALPIAKELKP